LISENTECKQCHHLSRKGHSLIQTSV